MHETDMTKALLLTLRDWLATQDQPVQVTQIHLIVGQFTCVEPASLQFSFAAQTQGTEFDGVVLHIQETPLIAFCQPCGQEYRPELGLHYACPTCGQPMEEIRSGRELKIDRIEFQSFAVTPEARI
jgi:hydrogenase nickel incorporation protein HypA/HybF